MHGGDAEIRVVYCVEIIATIYNIATSRTYNGIIAATPMDKVILISTHE